MKDRTVLVQDEELRFAENLKALRKTHKPYLSQGRLAERLGVCRTTYINYEMGRRQAPAFFVAKAAKFFRVSADKMLNEKLWKE